jgi:hypothetical protein
MSNIQFYFAIGVPFFTVLLVWIGGTIANRSAINDLRTENRSAIVDLRSEMKAGFDGINRRLDSLETRFDRMDNEIRKDHEHRITMLEERVFGRLA